MKRNIAQQLNDIEELLKKDFEETQRLRRIRENEHSLRPRFVESSPEKRSFGTLIDRIYEDILIFIRNEGGKDLEVRVMGYFDQVLVDKLKNILAQQGKVKITSPELKPNRREDRINLDALKRMEKNGAEVKIHPMLHARIFYVDMKGRRQVITGSGDIKSDCLGGRRFDAGIWSNHPDVTSSTFDFFNRVWEDDRAMNLSEIR